MNRRETALQLLIEERDGIVQAIEALTGPRRLGRPRKEELKAPWNGPEGIVKNLQSPKKRKFSAATRKKMAAAQKARWAKAKKSKPAEKVMAAGR